MTLDLNICATGIYSRLNDTITRLALNNYSGISRNSQDFKNIQQIRIIIESASYSAPRRAGINILSLPCIGGIATRLRV